MHKFVPKFLCAIEAQESEPNNDLGKKANDLLSRFLQDLKESSSRSMSLDRDIIMKLQEFLVKCDESKRVSLNTSLDWLFNFIDFFAADF
jgi:hypothetical protein